MWDQILQKQRLTPFLASLLISLSFSFEGQRGMKLWDLLLMMFFLQLNPVNWEVVQSLIMKWATCSQRSCHHFLRGSLHRVGRSFDMMIWKEYINVDTLWQILFTLLFFKIYIYFCQLQFFYIYSQSFVYYFFIFSIQIFLSRLFNYCKNFWLTQCVHICAHISSQNSTQSFLYISFLRDS